LAPCKHLYTVNSHRTKAEALALEACGDSKLLHSCVLQSVQRSRTQDGDEALALEACEFWPAFADSALDPSLLAPHLPQLVPLLLRNMVYGEFDEEVVDTEAAEAAGPGAPDADADVRPFHHR
jgi:hypothetical protein